MAFAVDDEVAGGDELAEHPLPPRLVELGADAEGLQPVVAELGDAVARLAGQHVDEMADAEALAGAVDRRDRLLRRDRPVPALDRGEAGVAIAAGPVPRLAEVGEQDLAPARSGLAVGEQR